MPENLTEKDRAVEMLKSNGFSASNHSGVVIIRMSADDYKAGLSSKAESLLKNAGYNASRGYITYNGNSALSDKKEDYEEESFPSDSEEDEEVPVSDGIMVREDGQMSLF